MSMGRRTSSEGLKFMAKSISWRYLLILTVSSCTLLGSNCGLAASLPSPSFSIEESGIDPQELLQLQAQQQDQLSPSDVIIPAIPSTFHVVDDTECVKITMDEGVFHFKSRGGEQVCGLYFTADPDKSIHITFDYLDVRCMDKGLISVVDGWEMNGEVFPSIDDHEKPPQERFHDLCVEAKRKPHASHRMELRRTFTSSQNAALIQYRIPTRGQGFSVRVHHVPNPRPCNILVQDLKGLYTLENHGQDLNCSLATLFDAKIRILYMRTGISGSKLKFPTASTRIHSTGVYHKCGKMGLEDYVQIGGSSGLDTSKMQLIDEQCGYQYHPVNKYTTVFCGFTTLRLVSSGKYENKIVAEVSKAEIEDLDSANYICGM